MENIYKLKANPAFTVIEMQSIFTGKTDIVSIELAEKGYIEISVKGVDSYKQLILDFNNELYFEKIIMFNFDKTVFIDKDKRHDTVMFVSNLPPDLTEHRLTYVLNKFNIKVVTIARNKYSNLSKGYGFVFFYNTQDMEECIRTSYIVNNNTLIFGKALKNYNLAYVINVVNKGLRGLKEDKIMF